MPLQDTLSYVVKPDWIIDRKIKQLIHKSIPLVKVVRNELTTNKATWETKAEMRETPRVIQSRYVEFWEQNPSTSSPFTPSDIENLQLVLRSKSV